MLQKKSMLAPRWALVPVALGRYPLTRAYGAALIAGYAAYLFLSLKAADGFDNVRIERVGDCVAPRLIQSNIAEAFDVALTL